MLIMTSSSDTSLCPFDCQCCKLLLQSLDRPGSSPASARFLNLEPVVPISPANISSSSLHKSSVGFQVAGSIEALLTAFAMVERGQCAANININHPPLPTTTLGGTHGLLKDLVHYRVEYMLFV